MQKTVVIILTHFINCGLIEKYTRMRAQAGAKYDIFIACNLGKDDLTIPPEGALVCDAIYLCNIATLTALPYPEKCKPEGWSGNGWTFNGNADTIVLSFYRAHPEYAYYWGIEYDVHYEGNWKFLFDHFVSSEAALLGTMIHDAVRVPKRFPMKPPFHDSAGNSVDPKDSLVGFFPIHRLSRRLLETLNREYEKGWNGHYEFTWGTLARLHGLEIEDIGGNGPYVKPHNRNVFYFNNISRWDLGPGTFIWRPEFIRIHPRENTLWHPLKPHGDYVNHYEPEYIKKRGLKRILAKFKYNTKLVIFNIAVWWWFKLVWRSATANAAVAMEAIEQNQAA